MNTKLVFRLCSVLAVLSVVSLGLTGCSSTHYRSVTREPNGIVTERELKAEQFMVKRELGKVILGADSLDGSKSDQMQAASEALALAAAALKR